MTMNPELRLETHQNPVRLKYDIPEQPSDNVQNHTDHDIHMEAGDFLFSRTNKFNSGLIRFFTVSDWSHVAIAISSNFVLEATKEKGVDDISLEKFLENNESVILFRRSQEDALSTSQKEKLQGLVPLMKEKSYTMLHTGFTAFPTLIFYLVSAAILSSVFDLIGTLIFILISFIAHLSLSIWNSRIHLRVPISGGWFRKICLVIAIVAISYLIVDLLMRIHEITMSRLMASMVWSIICGLLGGALIWFFRTQWGGAMTERIYCKTRLGRAVVKKGYDMWCSRLVLKADQEIGGPLAALTPGEMEVQPEHLFNACQKLWGPGCLIKGEKRN